MIHQSVEQGSAGILKVEVENPEINVCCSYQVLVAGGNNSTPDVLILLKRARHLQADQCGGGPRSLLRGLTHLLLHEDLVLHLRSVEDAPERLLHAQVHVRRRAVIRDAEGPLHAGESRHPVARLKALPLHKDVTSQPGALAYLRRPGCS